MGMKRSFCSEDGLNKGAWTATEDKLLISCIKTHGEGKWRSLPKKAGLKRSGKSCRLRWLNYLRPDIKRGNITHDEEELIIRLHKLLGNRWSLIAGRLPGRTDNEIKNYWNTTLAKKINAGPPKSTIERRPSPTCQSKEKINAAIWHPPHTQVVRTKASRCTRIPEISPHMFSSVDCSNINQAKDDAEAKNPKEMQLQTHLGPQAIDHANRCPDDFMMDFDMEEEQEEVCVRSSSCHPDTSFFPVLSDEILVGNGMVEGMNRNDNSLRPLFDHSISFKEAMMIDISMRNGCVSTDINSAMESLSSFLDLEQEWL